MNDAIEALRRFLNMGGFSNLESIYTLIGASKVNAYMLADMMFNNTLEERLAIIGCARLHGGETCVKVIEEANDIILKWQVNALRIAVKSNNQEKFFSYFGPRELVEFSKIILSKEEGDAIDEVCLSLIDEEIGKQMTDEVKPSRLDALVKSGRIAAFEDSTDFSL